jgi:hypothetical protein
VHTVDANHTVAAAKWMVEQCLGSTEARS